VAECQEYCVMDPSCVGVDVDYTLTPVRCWKHEDENDYRDANIYTQPGTTIYQLITRCASTAVTGTETSETTTC